MLLLLPTVRCRVKCPNLPMPLGIWTREMRRPIYRDSSDGRRTYNGPIRRDFDVTYIEGLAGAGEEHV